MQVKVCRVEDLHTSRVCGDLGVDMIGLHAIEGIDEHTARRYARIAGELHQFYPRTIPVLVTKVTSPATLEGMLADTHVRRLQLHVPLEPGGAEGLLAKLERGLGWRPSLIAAVAADDPQAMERVAEARGVADYILIDASYRGGTGRPVDLGTARRLREAARPAKVLLAGGLTPNNVRGRALAVQPDGVDAQSGLEGGPGAHRKDPRLLVHFVNEAKGEQLREWCSAPNRALVSVAMTAVPEGRVNPTLRRFALTDVDLVHLDFSDGTVAPAFRAAPRHVLREIASICPCLPYDVHLFVSCPTRQLDILAAALEVHPLLRVAYIHLCGPQDSTANQLRNFAGICSKLGIAMGVALQGTGFTPHSLCGVLNEVLRNPVHDISLITRSRAHNAAEVRELDLPLLDAIVSRVQSEQTRPHVSVDRDLNLEKLALLSKGRPSHAIVGMALLTSRSPQRRVSAIRRLLAPRRWHASVRRDTYELG